MFLAEHPAWTWQQLQDTPADVVALLRRLDGIRAEHARGGD